jgi:2-octaprenylphenol hydroxylase
MGRGTKSWAELFVTKIVSRSGIVLKKTTFDVVILGGGIVGLTAALCCAEKGLSIGLVEKEALNFAETAEIDVRCSAISRASQVIFRSLGVWDLMPMERLSAYQRMVVWDAKGFGKIIFDAAEIAESDLGHIIENKILLQALITQVKNNPHIQLFSGQSAKSVSIDEKMAVLTLQDDSSIQAKCLIGADGNRSWLRTALSFEVETKQYEQAAVIANVETEKSHENTAWQRFLSEGPLAFLPLFESNRCSIVWTTSLPEAAALQKLAEQDFCETLRHAFDGHLGKILSCSLRQSFPLSRLTVKESVRARVALIGDAAHVVHPLAGQGLNMGIQDANQLAETLAKAHASGFDLGHWLHLRRYARAANHQNKVATWVIDVLNTIFMAQSDWLMGVRSVGLNFIHQNPLIKRKLIKTAMGI